MAIIEILTSRRLSQWDGSCARVVLRPGKEVVSCFLVHQLYIVHDIQRERPIQYITLIGEVSRKQRFLPSVVIIMVWKKKQRSARGEAAMNSKSRCPSTIRGCLKNDLDYPSNHSSLSHRHDGSIGSRSIPTKCSGSSSGGNRASADHRSSASSSDGGTSGRLIKEVIFTDIHIREFERIVGDNPSCSSGPPIA